MGKPFGAGKTTDIHEGLNLEFLQEGKKIRHGPVGVSDGENFNACVVDGFQELGGLILVPQTKGCQLHTMGEVLTLANG